MNEQSKRVALPAYLRRRLDAFRIVKGDTVSYILRDKLRDKVIDLEPWQFFVLEVLPASDTAPKLLAVFEDRFGRQITEPELLSFFGWLADKDVLGDDAASHPLLEPFTKPGFSLDQGLLKPRSFEELAASIAVGGVSPAVAKAKPVESPEAEGAELPAGVADADNLDPRRSGRILRLFDLRPFLSFAVPLLTPLRWGAYVVPVAALLALMLLFQHSRLAVVDLESLSRFTTLASHVVASLLTINLAAVMTQAFVAHKYRATVTDLGIAFYLGFLPRFVVRIRNTKQLSRRERMWIHGGPLLVRVALFSLGVLVWYSSRDAHRLLSQSGLALAFMSAINMIVGSANPLVRGNAYHLLAAYVDEPRLRGKAYRAFWSKVRGDDTAESESNLLAAYALATFIYVYVVAAIAVFVIANFLKRFELGGAAIVVALAVGAFLLYRSVKKFRTIGQIYERAVQFDRWRKRTLPAEASEAKQAAEPARSRTASYVLRVLALLLLLLLFLPYPYEAGGQFQIYPAERQVITTNVTGIIEEVNFDGGESVKKGAVIGRIASTDLKAELDVFDAKIAEQRAVIADLKAKPKPEEVVVAQRALEVAQQRAQYSGARVPRLETLYQDKVIAFEELDAARKEADVDVREVAQREADLQLVKSGVTAERLMAEAAKLDSLVRQRAVIEGRVTRTTMVMPFDGSILTLHLKDRLNSVLERGQPFTAVESSQSVTAEIDVPEQEIGYVKPGAVVRARPNAYSDEVFEGKVQTIDRNVSVKPSGNVVKIIAVIENPDGRLRTGMTGFGKIGGEKMPVWRAFTLGVQRFFSVEVWSWIP